MTLPLNPETLAAAYDFLKVTPPFDQWNLPDSEEVGFKLSRNRKVLGHYQWDGKRHNITASVISIGHSWTLMRFMAHEMIHLHLEATDMESRRGGSDTHNAPFRKYAAQVCKHHGFDPKSFY